MNREELQEEMRFLYGLWYSTLICIISLKRTKKV